MATCESKCKILLLLSLFSLVRIIPALVSDKDDDYFRYWVAEARHDVHRLHRSERSVAERPAASLPVPLQSNVTSTTQQTPPTGLKNSTVVMPITSTSASPPVSVASVSPVANNTSSNSSSVSNSTASSETAGSKGATNSSSTPSTPRATTTPGEDEEPYPMYPNVPNNKTLEKYHINKTEEDHHKYYNSTFIADENIGHALWVNMSDRPDAKTHSMLSTSHRRAATVRLTFDFPFYGYLVRNVTIATGGFVYTGDYVHSWLAATQYIAPLMANFDTSISNSSFIKFVDNGTAFTVQWENVVLQDRPESGNFTFQTTLFDNGNIVFVYQKIPIDIDAIKDEHHPVKVGLSDAYIVDRNIFFVRRKTIYEYHRVNFRKDNIRNWTAFQLVALPTCVEHKDCRTCLSQESSLTCHWCTKLGRCSDGYDRLRQEWMHQDCHYDNVTRVEQCDSSPADMAPPTGQSVPQSASSQEQHEHTAETYEPQPASGVGTIVVFLLTGILVVSFLMWVTYAYRNPHTASGQLLIRYRPSQWRWRRGEARYTAATIHM